MILCWLLGTSVRKTSRFLRTDMPRSQHTELFSQHSISMTQNDLLFPKIHPLLLRSLAEILLRIPWHFRQGSNHLALVETATWCRGCPCLVVQSGTTKSRHSSGGSARESSFHSARSVW